MPRQSALAPFAPSDDRLPERWDEAGPGLGLRRRQLAALIGQAGLLSLAPGRVEAQQDSLRIASFSVTPYVMDDGQGRPIGALVDYFDQEVAPRAGLRLLWQDVVTVQRLMRGLQDGTVDCCPILTSSPERWGKLRFAARSHWRFESVLALRPDHPLAAKARIQPEDLDLLRLGWIQAAPLPPELLRPSIRWDLTSVAAWERSILVRVERGQLDAGYFSNPATPTWYLRANRHALVLRPLEVAVRALYTAFSLRSSAALQARIELACAASATLLEAHLARWQGQAGGGQPPQR